MVINSFSLLFTRHIASDSPAAPWTAACQTPPSTGFPGQECWSGLPFPPPGDLSDSFQTASPALAMSSLSLSHQGSLMNSFSFCLFRRLFLISSSALNDGVFLVPGFPLSSLWTCCVIPFWLAECLLGNQQMVLWEFLFIQRAVFLLQLLRFSLYYHLFWCFDLLCSITWRFLCFLDLSVFLPRLWESWSQFCHIIFLPPSLYSFRAL